VESSIFNWDKRLPGYLTKEEKGRLRFALEQFSKGKSGEKLEIDYSDFFLNNQPQFLLQGDLVHSVPFPFWNERSQNFETDQTLGILISNSCDVAQENTRLSAKHAVFAPIIPVFEYAKDLIEQGENAQKVDSIIVQLKQQIFTNLIYVPHPDNTKEGFLAFLDKAFHVAPSVVKKLCDNLESERYITLSNFGSYLFIVKLSFHFCRVPEEIERKSA